MTSLTERQSQSVVGMVRRPWLMRMISAAALAGACVGLAPMPSAQAADLGGNCCADLEERIAELEATTARKGNRKLSLTIAGQVNQTLLFWDDGHESNAYIVGNKNDQTNFSFTGSAEITKGWTAGYELVLRLRDGLSDGVSQISDEAPDEVFQIWQSHWFIESEHWGKFSLGQASRVSDTAPERDLSEAGVAGYAGVQDIGGGFFLRRADGGLATLAWGDVYNHFNGDTATVVRYDTPTWQGFSLAASWGEDDIWDVGVSYSHESKLMKLEAAVAYTETTDDNGLDGSGDVDNSTLVGSISILHVPTGLNVTVAGGRREFDAAVVDADGALRRPADASYIYAKLGWIAELNKLGPTAFYGEYGRFNDFLSAGLDADGVASLSFTDAANICGAAGAACRVTGNEADVWGFGVVQHVEAAEMQLYVGYRRHSIDVDIVDNAGSRAQSAGLEDFDTVIAGSKIAF